VEVGSVKRLRKFARGPRIRIRSCNECWRFEFCVGFIFLVVHLAFGVMLRDRKAQSFDLLMTRRLRVANECFSSRGGSFSGFNALLSREQGSLLRVETLRKNRTSSDCSVTRLKRIVV
jgi:hypothetical protein